MERFPITSPGPADCVMVAFGVVPLAGTVGVCVGVARVGQGTSYLEMISWYRLIPLFDTNAVQEFPMSVKPAKQYHREKVRT